MLRAKRRRTRMHDSKGNPIFNTNNSTSKENKYVMKNNYLETLKSKGNDHNSCKRYYSDEEVVEKHQENLKDASLDLNFASYTFNTTSCISGIFSVRYDNTDNHSGKYKYYKNYTYYLDRPITGKDSTNTDISSVVFMTFAFDINSRIISLGEWGIMGFPISSSIGDFDANVKYIYDNCIEGGLIKPSDFNNACSVLTLKTEVVNKNDITKHYNSVWYDGGDTSSPGVRIIMTPDYKHSQADIIKNKLSMRYCKTNIGRNPILGYRKQLECDIKNIENKTILIKFPDNLSFTDGTNIFKFSELYNGEYKESDIVGRYNGKDQYNYISYEFYREEWIISVLSSKISSIITLTSGGNKNFDINKLNNELFNWKIIAFNRALLNPNIISNNHFKITYSICPKNPTNDIYKDNYAKTCGKFRKNGTTNLANSGYSNVILPKQNNKGIVDASYNYSTSQYLSRPNFMKCNNVYKKSNPRFSTQGAVSAGSRLNRLKYQTMVKSQQKFNTLSNIVFKFKLKVGYWQPTSQLKLYGYGDGNGITTIPGSLIPDNFKGNQIPTLNITENSTTNTYGLQIYFNKKIENQLTQNMLNNFKIILNYNDIYIQLKYSDLTQYYDYRIQFEYDFDDDDTHPNYNLFKNIIDNGNIIGKTINIIFIFNKLNSENILTIKKILDNKHVTNMVNGVYPSTLYRNTRPIHKSIHSTNFKCKGRSCNGLLQFCANSK